MPALLNVGLFRTPSFDHPLYWIPIMVFIPAGLAVALLEIDRKSPGVSALVASVVFLSWLALDIEYDHAAFDQPRFYPTVAELVERFADPDDLVLSPEPLGPAMFYTKVRFFGGVNDVAALEGVLEKRTQFSRPHVFMADSSLRAHPGLVTWLDERASRIQHLEHTAWVLQP